MPMGRRRINNIEFIGQRFGRLVVASVEIIKKGDISYSFANVICDCGKIKQCFLHSLRNGSTKSCGCLFKEIVTINCGKINLNHGHSRHPLYSVWKGMVSRCYNKKQMYYNRYGGEGVTVCDEWRTDFLKFYEWAINNGWKKGLEIDKDIKGNGKFYSPGTCIFVTRKENGRKKRNSLLINYDGETKALSEWCESLGLKYTTIRHRLRTGMEPSTAFIKKSYA